MDFWNKILDKLIEEKHLCLMVVVESIGSSPGRQGFKMVVGEDGQMEGSIGGGFMEHKLVELCKSLLKKKQFTPFLKRQIHRAESPANRSGMICSGEQTIAFYSLSSNDKGWIEQLIESPEEGILKLTSDKILFQKEPNADNSINFQKISEEEWVYKEQPGFENIVYIIGGGHVGLALSRTMNELGFKVIVFDDRPGLNTMEQNRFAHLKKCIDYKTIEKEIEEGENRYVVLMSFGFRSDELVLRQLLGKKFAYFGVMGSKEKMNQLLKKLAADGFSEKALKNLHTPIGIPISSKTPAEIAISIAAEIIKVKNE